MVIESCVPGPAVPASSGNALNGRTGTGHIVQLHRTRSQAHGPISGPPSPQHKVATRSPQSLGNRHAHVPAGCVPAERINSLRQGQATHLAATEPCVGTGDQARGRVGNGGDWMKTGWSGWWCGLVSCGGQGG